MKNKKTKIPPIYWEPNKYKLAVWPYYYVITDDWDELFCIAQQISAIGLGFC